MLIVCPEWTVKVPAFEVESDVDWAVQLTSVFISHTYISAVIIGSVCITQLAKKGLVLVLLYTTSLVEVSWSQFFKGENQRIFTSCLCFLPLSCLRWFPSSVWSPAALPHQTTTSAFTSSPLFTLFPVHMLGCVFWLHSLCREQVPSL